MAESMNRRDILKLGAALPAIGLAQSKAAWTPSFFSAHQNETMVVFGEVVIPGATEAQVNRYLDKLLAASDHSFQNEFVGDLDALDRFASQNAGAGFIRLDPDQQRSVLGKMFESDQRPAFDRLKAWTARIYYATEAGFKELNRGGRVPGTFGCETPA